MNNQQAEKMMTEKTRATLQLVASLEGAAEAYVGGTQAATDAELGFLNPTHARRLAQAGWLEPLQDGKPLRVTVKAREFLAGVPAQTAPSSRPLSRTRRLL